MRETSCISTIGRTQDEDLANGHFYDRSENVYSDGSIADPGYYTDSDADPGYEIITKRKAPTLHSFTPPDSEYEVIKRSPHPLPPAHCNILTNIKLQRYTTQRK